MELFSIALIVMVFLAVNFFVYNRYILRGVSYEFSFSTDEAFEGDEIEFTETITNNKFLPVPWLKSEITCSEALEFSELSSVVTNGTRWVTSFFVLRGFSRIRRTWKVKCTKRGVFGTDRIIISAADALGLVKDYYMIDSTRLSAAKITVLPSCEDCDPEDRITGAYTGEIFTTPRLISDPFFVNGIREYRITDSVRSINWLATAKEQQLMVNKNDFTTDTDLTVILNIQSSPEDYISLKRPEITERCIRVCAGIICVNCSAGRRVHLMTNDISYGEMTGAVSTDEFQLLRELAQLKTEPAENFDRYLSHALYISGSSEIIVVSAYVTDDMEYMGLEYPGLVFVSPQFSGGAAV